MESLLSRFLFDLENAPRSLAAAGLGFVVTRRGMFHWIRWLPSDGSDCDRLQVDACLFEVGWLG